MKNKLWGVVGILSLGLFLPQAAFAIDVAKDLAVVIFHILLGPFILILQLELSILPKVAAYNSFISEQGVIVGWTILRDLANMFFILVLLVIAFATILRLKSYGFKQLLSRFIIVVILVNFSRTIVGLVIDIFQVVMLTFVSAIQNVMAGNIMVALGLEKLMAFTNAGEGSITGGEFLSVVFFGGVMLVVACVVIGIFIFTLALRIINIWLLVVAAPMAFLAYTVPRTEKYFHQWFDKLLNAALIGPVIAFLLWLSFTIVGNGKIYESFKDIESAEQVTDQELEDSNFAKVTTMDNVITYVIGIAFLFGSLLASKSLGTVGAGIGSKAAAKLQGTASSLGRRYAGGAASRTGALASRAFVDEHGEARAGLEVLNRVPLVSFWSRRVQRGAQKMQGYDAARIKKTKEADEKYILPQQKEAFERSQASQSFVPSFFGKKARVFGKELNLGRLASTITSAGGNFDRDTMLAQNKIDRGTVKDHKTAEQVSGRIHQVGDEDSAKKLQITRADAYQNPEEVQRAMQINGPKIISSRWEANSLADPVYEKDEQGNVKKDADGRSIIKKDDKGDNEYTPNGTAMMVVKTILADETIDGDAFAKAVGDLSGPTQAAFAAVLKKLDIDIEKAFKKDADGKTKFDADGPTGKQVLVGMQIAPEQFGRHYQGLPPEQKTALFSKVSKGMDFGKLAKINLDTQEQISAFISFAKNASNAQQRQLFDKGSEKQIQLMVDTLLDNEKEVNNLLRTYKEKSPYNKGKKAKGNDFDDDQQQDHTT